MRYLLLAAGAVVPVAVTAAYEPPPANARETAAAALAQAAPRPRPPPDAARSEPPPRAPAPGSCPDLAWGGYAGDARCAALAQRVIAGTDRACRVDADCALVHPGASCREQSASRAAAARYGAMPAACTHPAAGPCPPREAYCHQGCCATRRRR